MSKCEYGPGGGNEAEPLELSLIPSMGGKPDLFLWCAGYGSLMVRVGGGWVALDEFLVKNDPGRGDDQGWGLGGEGGSMASPQGLGEEEQEVPWALPRGRRAPILALFPGNLWAAKGRTSQKIHERFLCWAGAPSRPAPEVITLRLWASIHIASSRPLPRKVSVGKEFREVKWLLLGRQRSSLSPGGGTGLWGETWPSLPDRAAIHPGTQRPQLLQGQGPGGAHGGEPVRSHTRQTQDSTLRN